MKTIFWKELREHARWVPLGIIPMIAVLVLRWRSGRLVFDDDQGLSPLVGLVASGVAVCLGLLQSWPDQRPAARALLLHRGIGVNSAFWAKLLAGCLLYAVAVFVPLAGMALFIAAIGMEHRATSPNALLPSALISVAAFSGWPASMLVVYREARFWGSRLMPAFTAGLAVFGCGIIMYEVLWLGLTIVVVTLVVFCAAAGSVFISSSHIATGYGLAAMTIAVTMALLFVAMFVVTFDESYRISAVRSSSADLYRQHIVQLGPEGRPWLVRRSYSSSSYEYEVDEVAKMVPDRAVRNQLRPVGDEWDPLQKWSPYMRPPNRRMTAICLDWRSRRTRHSHPPKLGLRYQAGCGVGLS